MMPRWGQPARQQNGYERGLGHPKPDCQGSFCFFNRILKLKPKLRPSRVQKLKVNSGPAKAGPEEA